MSTRSDSDSFEALSSPIRLEILRVLARRQMSVSDLAEHLGLHGATVRYHLSPLVAQGLLKTVQTRGKGRRGRPPTAYRLVPGTAVIGFPRRQYEMLAELLLSALQANLDAGKLSEILHTYGVEAGLALGKGLIDHDPDLASHLDRYMLAIASTLRSEYGVDAEATIDGENDGTLTEFSCPFEELAMRRSDIICDHLDMGLHEGLAKALSGDVEAQKLKCKGHGDDVCRFRLVRK